MGLARIGCSLDETLVGQHSENGGVLVGGIWGVFPFPEENIAQSEGLQVVLQLLCGVWCSQCPTTSTLLGVKEATQILGVHDH